MSFLARFGGAMRLPSKLLGCMRVGVGVGAVMMGGGCDAIAEAKARVLGEELEVAADVTVVTPVAAPVAAAPAAPEPMLLGREGVAGVVEDAMARSNAAKLEGERSTTPPTFVPPVEDLGRPRREPEGSHAFVPYGGSSSVGTLAIAPERTEPAEEPRSRTRPKRARTVEAEPCDPSPEPVSTWVCGPCGRG